tara:strand:+ start:124 stop:1416 length:1293 start_codon:yes stop_codon:yes gene_type:complete
MDEEQSNKKINISSFFERVDSVDKVAGNALSKSNANFSAINNLQMLIQNISMSINEIRSDVREIANYIIVEKKLEMDRQLDEKFEAQDEQQKRAMLDRAKALGQPAPSTPQQKEEPVTAPKGGFLSGLLKAIAIGGIAALALPLIPVIAPLLLKAMAAGIIAIAGGLAIKETIALGIKLTKMITAGIGKAIEFGKNVYDNLSEKVSSLASNLSGFLSKKTEQLLKSKPVKAVKKIGADISDFAKEKGKQLKENTTKFIDGAKDKAKKVTGAVGGFLKDKLSQAKEIGGQALEIGKDIGGGVIEAMKTGKENVVKGVTKFADAATGNVFDLDKSGEGKTGILRAITGVADKTASLIGLQTDFDGRGSEKPDAGTGLQPIVQADAPQQSMASLLPTKSPVPFIKVLDNSYLSKVPTRSNMNEIPPEIAKLIA